MRMSELYDLKFLEDKLGKFDQSLNYPRISMREASLIYVEVDSTNELFEKIREINEDINQNPAFIWGFIRNLNTVHVRRALGENKIFNYSPAMKRTEFVKGKKKVLNDLCIDTIDDLFDQKAVFDYFYMKLWDLRLDLAKEIRDNNKLNDNIALMEAQHIIDRIIFTYFICQKGLVSEKEYGPITGQQLFSEIVSQMSDPWEYLKKLFFELFALEDVDEIIFEGDVHVIGPYLNGGLFLERKVNGINESSLVINKKWKKHSWDDIFELLNKYTWIIENEIPDYDYDYEGNLTPEVIGHIYEKFVITIAGLDELKLDNLNVTKSGDLKKGNRKIGAYYTPEDVTDVISRNTINNYLLEHLGVNSVDIYDFFNKSDDETLRKSLEILNELKICNPACGSGAFLLKAGEILLEYKTKIMKKLGNDYDNYSLKKEIIINNLYGVDIQKEAVEICKLRLWLWLITSSTGKVEPLPNIEYNFEAGNSLVGWTNEKLSQTILVKIDEKVLWTLDALKMGYGPEQKRIIDESMEYLTKTDMENIAKGMSILKGLYSYSSGENAEILKKTIERIKNVIYGELDRIFHYDVIVKQGKLSLENYINLNPFHWKVEFNDIFKKGGFDIIIGNPPYGNISNSDELKIFEKMYPHSISSKDASCFFIERSPNFLTDDGKFGMIVPLNILRIDKFLDVRRFLTDSINLYLIIDEGNPFEGQVELEMISLFYDFEPREKIDVISKKPVKSPPQGFTLEDVKNYNYRYIIYRDPLFELLMNGSDFEVLKVAQGIPRRADYDTNGEYLCLSAISLDPYIIRKDKIQADRLVTNDFINKKKLGKQLKECLITPFSLGRTGKVTDMAFECVLKPEGYLPDGTSIFIQLNKPVDKLFMLLLLNSRLINYFTCRYLLSYGVRIFRNYIFDILPVKYPNNIEPYIKMSKIAMFLSQHYYDNFVSEKREDEELKNLHKNVHNMANYLIYELYFKNNVKSNISELLNPYLPDIHLIKSGNEKLIAIKKAFTDFETNKEIKDCISKINSNKWVKTIEAFNEN